MTRVVGLSGGIGTGKSTVSRLFAALGAVVIDADAIVHELQAPGTPMLAEIAAAFGGEMLRPDGSLDRARLGRRVFADPAARARLGQLTHPAVGREMVRRLEAARAAGAALAIVDNPLLFEGRARRGSPPAETPRRAAEEETILVYAPAEAQIARQMTRDGVSREFAQQRLAAQMPIEAKRALATWVIDNSGSLAETEAQVRALYARLTAGEGAAAARD